MMKLLFTYFLIQATELGSWNREGAKNSGGKRQAYYQSKYVQVITRRVDQWFQLNLNTPSAISTGHLPEPKEGRNQCLTRPLLPVLTCDWY